MKLTQLRVSGFRSLRDVDLRPPNLCVLVDTEESATRDLTALLALIQAISEGGLQQHLLTSGVLDGLQATQPVRVELNFFDNHYGVELKRRTDGTWQVTWESVDLNAGVSALLVDPALDAPRAEASLLELAPGVAPSEPPDGLSQYDKEGWYVGYLLANWLWWMRCFLRDIQFDDGPRLDAPTLHFRVEPSRDPPPNSIWEQVQAMHSAARLSQVVLCTPSESLAESFDVREVIRVDMHEGAARFTPLSPSAPA
ncbi:AAA family ATPase [Myxococcus qinghaiensis]|uniref:hypothetical protein n=1 Tax=Myxococcus qinghaiensis TaxID=2906758 RepID=UPI0020A828C5|nr:hypothetical protein [Myxococcus qinghaiensis]MCP3164288.1 hypothetical protein [Myxococcus qinghaiensis]